MKKSVRHLVFAAVAIAPALVAVAQDAAAPDAASALSAKQEMIRDRLARLEDRMFRLRESLSETEPENARKLGDALRRASELDLESRLAAIVAALESADRLDHASQLQEDLVKDYQALLDTLLDRDPDDARRREQIQRLAEIKRDIEQLRQRQAQQREAAADSIRNQRLAQRISETLQQLGKILEKQKNLAEQAQQSPGEKEKQVEAQSELSERTKRMSQQIEKMAESDSGSAEEALDEAAEDTSSSAEAMQKAAETLKSGDEQAGEPQKDAIEKLEQAIERLQQAEKQLENQSQQASGSEQRAIAEETQKLAERMKGESEPSDEPTPGADNVERAEEHMQQAADKLDSADPEQATQQQDQAIDELDRAQQQIEEALRQKRQEEKEEILRGIESRLKQMIEQQTEVNAGSRTLHEKGADRFARADLLECAQLADRQSQIAGDGDTCVRLLEEDGTTVVFPQVMRQATADMRTVAARLTDGNVDATTLAVQADVRSTLAELLESLEKLRDDQQEKQQAGGQGGASGSGDDAALVPTSAELKLLRSAQRRINTVTTDAGEMSPDTEAEKSALLGRAAERQAELVEMAREMQKRSEKEHN